MKRISHEHFAVRSTWSDSLFFSLTDPVIDGFHRLDAMSLQAARSIVDDGHAHSLAVTLAKSPSELIVLRNQLARTMDERIESYGRQVSAIIEKMSIELIAIATAQCDAHQRRPQASDEVPSRDLSQTKTTHSIFWTSTGGDVQIAKQSGRRTP